MRCPCLQLRTRATTLNHYISSADELYAAGLRLLQAELPVELRLMGLRVSNFLEQRRERGQLSLEQMLARRQGGQGQQHGWKVRLPQRQAVSRQQDSCGRGQRQEAQPQAAHLRGHG